MTIEIKYSDECGYQVVVDGQVILECLGDEDLQDLTIGEISEIKKFLNFLLTYPCRYGTV